MVETSPRIHHLGRSFLLALSAAAQSREIRGTVFSSSTKERLPYVNVSVRGRQSGTFAVDGASVIGTVKPISLKSDRHLELRLSANDIFGTGTVRYHYSSNGIKQTYRNYYDTRQVKATVLWRFGKGENAAHTIHKPDDEERRRL